MSHRGRLLGRGQEADLLTPRLRVRRATTLVLLSVVAPGSAQALVGNRWVGRIALALWVLLLAALAWVALSYDRASLIGLAADPGALLLVRVGVAVVALAWIALFIDAWRLARPLSLPRNRGVAFMVLNTVVVMGVVTAAVYSSQVVSTQRDVVQQVFTATETKPPLQGRYNILLIGSDSGADRTGIRPDSMTVVSIDATTGSTVLVSLPRNLQNVPFPEDSPMRELYPFGYNCGSECLINAVHTAVEGRSDLYPGSQDPGLDATIDAVEGATALPINYYVMVNLKGFRSLVDAVGGVQMDVKTRLAKFGAADAYKQVYIEPGLQTLDGDDALWYARSRIQSDDYTRMGRQKCLMAAMLEQLSPQKVLLNAQGIARSGAQLLDTDLPASELGAFADLALKARGGQIATVSLVPPEVDVAAPDYAVVHQMIADAIAESEGGGSSTRQDEADDDDTLQAQPEVQPQTPPGLEPVPGSPEDPTVSQEAANNADDLSASC